MEEEGGATFIKLGLPYRLIEMGGDQEYIAVEVWERGEGISVINYYNPCKRLLIDNLLSIQGQDRQKVIWCTDFNAHSPMWGGVQTDANGKIIEELMDERELVSLNDGSGTRINLVSGMESALDSNFSV